MNLITFNIDDKLINNENQKILNSKKNLLFSNTCQDIKDYQKKTKNKVAKVFTYKNNLSISKNYRYLENVYFEILEYLKICLNKAHKKNYDKHYWEILVGKWLKTLVHQSFANWEILRKIEKKYNVNSFYKISLRDETFIPENTLHAHILIRSNLHKYNLFHHWLLSKMIDERDIDTINFDVKKNLDLKKEIFKLNEPDKFHKIFYKSFNNKIFYYQWEVPKEIKIKIMKHFKFINLPLGVKKINKYNQENLDREAIFYYKKTKDNYKSFLRKIIKFTLPRIYLENYKTLEDHYKKLNWPKNPKYILTSYPYYDELFKFYCAQKYISGSKTIITQHGYDNIYKNDNWFVNKMFANQLCWGANKKKGLHKFIFTKNYVDRENQFKFNKAKKILLILYSFIEMEDRTPDGYLDSLSINKLIFNSTNKYLKSLSKNLKKRNVIKALQETRYPALENSLKKEHKSLKFINIDIPFKKIINQYNLSVHFFIGTPFFESIYLNRPAIIIFDKKVNYRLNEKFLRFIQKFKENNICFESSIKAANFINKNYDNLEDWWRSPTRQRILKDFKENFCRHSNDLSTEFEKISKI